MRNCLCGDGACTTEGCRIERDRSQGFKRVVDALFNMRDRSARLDALAPKVPRIKGKKLRHRRKLAREFGAGQ